MIFDSRKKTSKLSDGKAKTPAHLNYDTNELVAQLIDHYGNKVDEFVAGQTWYFNFGDEFDSDEDYELVVYVERTGPDMRSDDVYLSGKLESLGGGDIIVEKQHIIRKSAYAKGGVKYVAEWIDKLRKQIVEAAEKKGIKRTRSSWSAQMDDSAREYYEDRVAQTWKLTPKIKSAIQDYQRRFDMYLEFQQKSNAPFQYGPVMQYYKKHRYYAKYYEFTITSRVVFDYDAGRAGWSYIEDSAVHTTVEYYDLRELLKAERALDKEKDSAESYISIYGRPDNHPDSTEIMRNALERYRKEKQKALEPVTEEFHIPIDVHKLTGKENKDTDYIVALIKKGNEMAVKWLEKQDIESPSNELDKIAEWASGTWR